MAFQLSIGLRVNEETTFKFHLITRPFKRWLVAILLDSADSDIAMPATLEIYWD